MLFLHVLAVVERKVLLWQLVHQLLVAEPLTLRAYLGHLLWWYHIKVPLYLKIEARKRKSKNNVSPFHSSSCRVAVCAVTLADVRMPGGTQV